MNNEHVKGEINKVKGKVKENVGHATGNSKMEREGILERVKGTIQRELGDLKDKGKEALDSFLDKDRRHSA